MHQCCSYIEHYNNCVVKTKEGSPQSKVFLSSWTWLIVVFDIPELPLFWERAGRLICFFRTLCAFGMLNKTLLYLISFLLAVCCSCWCIVGSGCNSFSLLFLGFYNAGLFLRIQSQEEVQAVLYYSSEVMMERSWQDLWTYWSHPLVSCLTPCGWGEKKVGSRTPPLGSL